MTGSRKGIVMSLQAQPLPPPQPSKNILTSNFQRERVQNFIFVEQTVQNEIKIMSLFSKALVFKHQRKRFRKMFRSNMPSEKYFIYFFLIIYEYLN